MFTSARLSDEEDRGLLLSIAEKQARWSDELIDEFADAFAYITDRLRTTATSAPRNERGYSSLHCSHWLILGATTRLRLPPGAAGTKVPPFRVVGSAPDAAQEPGLG